MTIEEQIAQLEAMRDELEPRRAQAEADMRVVWAERELHDRAWETIYFKARILKETLAFLRGHEVGELSKQYVLSEDEIQELVANFNVSAPKTTTWRDEPPLL